MAGFLRVNGVDVIPLVEAELNRRFAGRAGRRAADPDGLRGPGRARADVGGHPRAGGGDAGRHGRCFGRRGVVVRDDAAAPGHGHGHVAGRAILDIKQPFRPTGQPSIEYETDGNDMSVFATVTPSHPDVLEVRAGRVAMVRDFLATVTSDHLAATRKKLVGSPIPRDHLVLPACDPRGGVGAPPLRRPRPRRD